MDKKFEHKTELLELLKIKTELLELKEKQNKLIDEKIEEINEGIKMVVFLNSFVQFELK